MKLSDTKALRDFERACDELFDEWLGRWRSGAAAVASAGAVAVDRGEEYEVRIEAAVADPQAIYVEVGETSLIVRIPAGAGPAAEHKVTFVQPIDRERATSRWQNGMLTVTLPKQRGRRLKVQ